MADRWQIRGQRHLAGPAHQIFTTLGARLIREKRYREAITLLSRAVAAMPLASFGSEHWEAIGHLGHAYEMAGETDTAIGIFSEAIANGSNNRLTFTRYLMFLEREKQYPQVLRVINQGLKVQKDAAWEADLRKRQQRVEEKSGKVPRGTPREIIPAYSIRKGKKSVSLLHQIKLSPQLTSLVATENGQVFLSLGGKITRFSAWNLDSAEMVWETEIPESVKGIMASEQGVVAYSSQGKIGEGATTIYFFDCNGELMNRQMLPDVASDIVAAQEFVFAGCRDGRLYAFHIQGNLSWSYSVPDTSDPQDSASMRPCPYYVCAESDRVAFSSFSDVYALNNRGQLLWRWTVPPRESVHHVGVLTLTVSSGSAPVRGIVLSSDGKSIVLTAGDTVFEIRDGKIRNQIRRKDQYLGLIAADRTSAYWVISAGERVIILRDRKLVGSFAAPYGVRLFVNSVADRILAWSGNELLIATLSGKIISQIEFVKRISDAYCLNDGRIVVGAGHLIIFQTVVESTTGVQSIVEAVDREPIAQEQTVTAAPVERVHSEQGIPIRWFEGEKLESGPGKAMYRGQDDQVLTIEQLALTRYGQLGYKGLWTENQYWWAIMSLLFWDVVFARIPGVFTPVFEFPSTMQDMPNDFFTPDFYPRRRKLIESRMKELTRSSLLGMRKPDIEGELRSALRRHLNEPCRSIDWPSFTARFPQRDDLLMAPRLLTNEQIMSIMQRLLVNFAENRRGLPDLFLSREGTPLFAEVKGEREAVADHQIAWLRYLKDQVGVTVEICRIAAK